MIDDIKKTLILQNKHWDGQHYVHAFKRLHDDAVIKNLNMQEMHIITGIRRCGKSTLIETTINHLMQTVNPKSILYLNLDDPKYTEVCKDVRNLDTVVTFAESVSTQKIDYLFLDEVQNIEAWEKFVKSKYDSKVFKKICISGSNGDLLNSDYATKLTGRYIESHIYPMSYRELLMPHGIDDRIKLIKEMALALRLTDQMMMFGGFPSVHLLDNHEQRMILLEKYYETILLKDCIANHEVRNTKLFMQLVSFMVNHTSSLYSYNSIAKALDTSENTAQQFIQITENAYLLNELRQYSYSLKVQAKAKKKIYSIDNGLINATTFKFSHNHGKLLENLVYSELLKQGYSEIYFDNDTKECDFIVHDAKVLFAVQVCYEFHDGNRERELAGLKQAMKKYKLKRGFIITYAYEEDVEEGIQIVPFYSFFSGLYSKNEF